MLERSKLGPPARVLRLLRLGSRALGAVLLALLAGAASGEVRTLRADIRVVAVVPRFVHVRMDSSPALLVITPEHIRVGHVDVPEGTVFTVRCNGTHGLALQVHVDVPWIDGGTVTGAGLPVSLSGGAAVLRLAGPHPRETRIELRWRLRLAPYARPGTYPWPVRIQMQGL